MRLPRQVGIERFEAFGRGAQQQGCITPRVRANAIWACSRSTPRDPAPRAGRSPQSPAAPPRLPARRRRTSLRGGHCALAAEPWAGCQLGSRCKNAAAAAGPRVPARETRSARARLPRPHQERGCACTVPGPPIGVGLRIGGVGERGVTAAARLGRGGSVGRRAHQRVPKAHARTELDQPAFSAGTTVSAAMPSLSSARSSKVTSPTGSAAATKSSSRASSGSDSMRRRKLCSMRPDSVRASGSPNRRPSGPASSYAVTPTRPRDYLASRPRSDHAPAGPDVRAQPRPATAARRDRRDPR